MDYNYKIKLDETQILEEIKKLEYWGIGKDKNIYYIVRNYDFGIIDTNSFLKTKIFVDKVSCLAEKYKHYPDISFGRGYANIRLQTLPVSGLSEIDFEMAHEIDKFY